VTPRNPHHYPPRRALQLGLGDAVIFAMIHLFHLCLSGGSDNTAQALTWWQHLGALHEATNAVHWEKCFVWYPLNGMVVNCSQVTYILVHL
jgi:hypothetical protein